MSNSVQPHRRQPTRLPRPWDSPGKNTGVGCHFLLQCRKVKVKGKSLSRVRLLATPWTVAHQAPPSMGFSRQEYWSGVPLPSPEVTSYLQANLSRQNACEIIESYRDLTCCFQTRFKQKGRQIKDNMLLLFGHSVMSNSLQPYGL